MSESGARLEQALALHHEGRLAAAISLCREVLALEPANGAALHLLGLTVARAGDAQQAVPLLAAAAQLQPGNATVHANLAGALSQAGRHAEALTSYVRALALQPDLAAAHRGRGVALVHLGNAEAALASFERALGLAPNDATTHHRRGVALAVLGRFAEALASLERALALAPGHAATHLLRGRMCLELRDPASALSSFEEVLKLAPQEFDAHFQRGIALAALERHEESVASFDQAIGLNESSAEALNNRGAVLVRLLRPAEALADFSRAVQLMPDYADAHINAGNTQRGLGRYGEALASLDHALSIRPDDPTARWSKAVLRLGMGELREGWSLFEARLELEPGRRLQRSFAAPRWNGDEPLAGRTLLVYAEQGLGDTLQFCRYVPVLERMGARLIFEVQPVLKLLLGSLDMHGTLIGRGEQLPHFDLHTPLASLPLALHTDLDTIPGGVPYLRADPRAVHAWAEPLSALPGLKVGLNWYGNPEAEKLSALQARSFPLATAAPLARLEGVTLVSLQKGAGAGQRTRVAFSDALVQLTDPLYMGPQEIAEETAAILNGLDLVITADTALAHLAGALGVRVWVVLQAVPDWRWLIERTDSPWYPTMRLFRQRTPGDWGEVFERVAAELAAWRDSRSAEPS
jgi:tetratricopeptide (TPR) repeat protein